MNWNEYNTFFLEMFIFLHYNQPIVMYSVQDTMKYYKLVQMLVMYMYVDSLCE